MNQSKIRIVSFLLAFAVLAAAACSSAPEAPLEASDEKPAAASEVVVFAAASLQETMEEIARDYAGTAKLTCSFDSSGTLRTQIEEGAECDLFISAAQKQMDELEAHGKVDGTSRIDLLSNKVVLAVPDGNPAGISGFDDLAERLRTGDILVAVGNSDVPVGQYTQKIFSYYGLDEQTLAQEGTLTYGSNVKEVTAQVSEGSVDCGIIYATDAFSAGLDAAGEATEEMCGSVIYPAAVLKDAPHRDAALALLDYLQTTAAMQIFESVGFSPAAGS